MGKEKRQKEVKVSVLHSEGWSPSLKFRKETGKRRNEVRYGHRPAFTRSGLEK